jgi:putative transcriptional regulator
MKNFTALSIAAFIFLTICAVTPYAAKESPKTSPPGNYKFEWGLAKGKLLVASENIKDPIFAGTVILLVDYSAQGAMGLIVNKPAGLKIPEALPGIEGLSAINDLLYFGGPVSGNQIFMLIQSESKLEESHNIFGDIYFSASIFALKRLVENIGRGDKFRLYIGYAGWAPGQLEREMARGDWHIIKGDASVIFDSNPADLWQRIMNRGLLAI